MLPLDGVRVLVADDHEINRAFVSTVLQDAGAIVIEAVDGVEAVEKAVMQRPDLVLMDIRMPGLDGVAAMLETRNRLGADAQHLRFIALTADAEPRSRESLLANGFDAYLAKPARREQLLQLLRLVREEARSKGVTQTTQPVIERAQGLRSGGSEAVWKTMLELLLAQLPDELKALEKEISEGQLPQAAERVHRMRGAASWCGALDLLDQGAALESSLRRNAYQPALLNRFVNSALLLEDEIKLLMTQEEQRTRE